MRLDVAIDSSRFHSALLCLVHPGILGAHCSMGAKYVSRCGDLCWESTMLEASKTADSGLQPQHNDSERSWMSSMEVERSGWIDAKYIVCTSIIPSWGTPWMCSSAGASKLHAPFCGFRRGAWKRHYFPLTLRSCWISTALLVSCAPLALQMFWNSWCVQVCKWRDDMMTRWFDDFFFFFFWLLLLDSGLSAKELKDMGFECRELVDFFEVRHLVNATFSKAGPQVAVGRNLMKFAVAVANSNQPFSGK